MRYIFLLAILSISNFTLSKNIIKKTTTPGWVQVVNVSDTTTLPDQGGYQYLLIDRQEFIPMESYYQHFAIKVLNAEGIQYMSDIDLTYDPSYQTLCFHQLQIIRNGRIIDKLKSAEIKTFQRETSMDRSLYDGSLSAVVNLTDVREGDIIEYAYSIKGFNPIHAGHFSTTLYQQYSIPVNRVFQRLIASPSKSLNFQKFEGATSPARKQYQGNQEYIWDLNAKEYLLVDNNTPGWYDPFKRVSVSTFSSWQEVTDWALPLYRFNKKQIGEINPIKTSHEASPMDVLKLIRVVQDEVRYLGFESGIGAYKPHNPVKIYNQRYGDCKDKSLLLVALLQDAGIESYPLLVNTQLKDQLKKELPSNQAFDHCVVYLKYHEKAYFVDPTISNQGGDLNNLTFPDYQNGLLIKPGNTQLIDIPGNTANTINETHIKELITMDSVGGAALLVVRTEYLGARSDYIRSYFKGSSKESIRKEYLNYYSRLYPDITSNGEIKLYDYERNSDNKVIVEEYYKIDNFWTGQKEGNEIYCEIYPIVLASMIGYTKSNSHHMPYYMGTPYLFTQETSVDLPENWQIPDYEKEIEGNGFFYRNQIHGKGNHVSIMHQYKLSKSYISGDSVKSMLTSHENIKDELPYYLTYNPTVSTFKLSWLGSFLVIVALSAGIFFSIKLFREYDPAPWRYAEDKPIGGWLILPAIGLVFSPIAIGRDLFTEGLLNQNVWNQVVNLNDGNAFDIYLLLGGEIIYNCLLLVYSFLVIISFFKRRTSVPILITVYYAINLIGPLADHFIVDMIIPGQLTDESTNETYRTFGRTFIGALVWIPYFNISERVKSTFCKTWNNTEIEKGMVYNK